MDIAFERAVPLMRIFSLEKALEFYTGFLGLAVDWEHRFDATAPVYLQVARGGLVLHLTEHHGDCCPGSTVYVPMTGLDAFHREITARGYAHMRPGIKATPWGSREVEVIDPFGNRIRFSEANLTERQLP